MISAKRASRPVLASVSFAFLVSGLLTTFSAQTPAAQAPPTVTYTDLHDFSASAGDPHTFSESNLAQGRDGNFYTESNGGGTFGNGTVFKITRSGTPTIVHSFDGTDGSNAIGGMTLGLDGSLYGDTWGGGSSGDGITFKITPAGVETPLHNFANTGDGTNPANVMVRDGAGNFWGTTNNSAAETIYKVTPQACSRPYTPSPMPMGKRAGSLRSAAMGASTEE